MKLDCPLEPASSFVGRKRSALRRMLHHSMRRITAFGLIRPTNWMPVFLVLLLAQGCVHAAAMAIPPGVAERLGAGQPQNLIIEFDDSAVESEVAGMRSKAHLVHDDAAILQLRAARYRDLKRQTLAALPAVEFATLIEYSHLPMTFLRLRSAAALDLLARHAGVRAIFTDEKKFPSLAQSLPLINQPQAAVAGDVGSGTTAVVVDTGVDYTRSAFGSCTAPGVPAACKVSVYQNIADTSTALDSNGHGTNVSGIVLGVAPDTRIAAFNVFGAGSSTSDSLIIQAINWAIANQVPYHVAAINLSLGDGVKYTSPCSNKGTNPYVTPVKNARAAGIATVAASGNEQFSDGISSPACTPLVVSVGAVYDANVGSISYTGKCSDTTTAADQVTCFSNSASFLTLLAPGAMISAAGYTMAGTSQATPHVTGAVAVLRAAFPGETIDQTVARLTASGTLVTDTRNGISKPRLNLLEAARPANDDFANRIAIVASSGSTGGASVLATTEAGEPAHAGNAGGGSVWWRWVAPAAGQVSLDTHGSSFDTLLSVYIGTSVAGLSAIAANDNDGSGSGLYFQAQAGTEYQIAVDGNNGATGSIVLNWSLNPAAQADVAVAAGAGFVPADGNTLVYTITVSNNGPQTATNVVLTANLAAGLGAVSAPSCAVAGTVLTCAIGSLASGAAGDTVITASASAPGTFATSASVSSDVPDQNGANNSTAISIVLAAPAPNDSDVPMLPPWAMAGMALFMLGVSGYLQRRRAASLH